MANRNEDNKQQLCEMLQNNDAIRDDDDDAIDKWLLLNTRKDTFLLPSTHIHLHHLLLLLFE